jgi:hypothetical protein
MTAVKTQTIPVPLLLTAQKAADLIGFERSTLRALLKAGKIKAKVRDGRRYFFTHTLLAYIASLPDANTIEDDQRCEARRSLFVARGRLDD